MTIDARWVILGRHVSFLKKTVVEVIMQLKMILQKRSSQSARWYHDNNKWLVGTEEYQWFHEKSKEHSPWMNLDDALVWIKERDICRGD